MATKNASDDILSHAETLFARAGYEGVSMRDIARAVGIMPASIYHHFPDKEQLYLSTVQRAFTEKTRELRSILIEGEPSWATLEAFVLAFTRLVATERGFHRLLRWVLLDAEPERVRNLADNVFWEINREVHALVRHLSPDLDPNLLTMSITGLVMQPFDLQQVSRVLPEYGPAHEDPDIIAHHIIALLRSGMGGHSSTASTRKPLEDAIT